MPWTTPTLRQVRQNARAYVMASLPGADSLIPNSNMRVMSDTNAGLAHLNLQYLDWQADQYLPDTAESEFLDRWANLFLKNADGSIGRKQATFASGPAVQFSGLPLLAVPAGTRINSGNGVIYQTTEHGTIGPAGTTIVPVVALTAGAIGNLPQGSTFQIVSALTSINSQAVATADIQGGTDTETDDELRVRVLGRLQEPPMGGDAEDYVKWALAVPGVTRAWSSPNEMGIGTVTIRFMMDDLRASNNGFPLESDVETAQSYMDTVRPVAVKDFFVVAPIPFQINFTIADLDNDTATTWSNIATSVTNMLFEQARPAMAVNGVTQSAQTIYAAWVSDAVLNAAGVGYFDLQMADAVMPNNGSIAVLGTIYHG